MLTDYCQGGYHNYRVEFERGDNIHILKGSCYTYPRAAAPGLAFSLHERAGAVDYSNHDRSKAHPRPKHFTSGLEAGERVYLR